MRPWFVSLILIAALAAANHARAEDLHYDQVEFTVESSGELQNDLAEVTLAAEAEHTDPAQLAAEINRAMSWALGEVRKRPAIESRSGDYQTYPVYDNTRLHHWRGTQHLILRSEKIEDLNVLAGALQQRLQIKSMQFIVSPARQRAGEAQLVDQAMENFKERAVRIQRSLGAKSYRIVRLSVQGAGAPPPMPMMFRMAKAEMDSGAPVAGEAGTSRQQIALQAVIQLQF